MNRFRLILAALLLAAALPMITLAAPKRVNVSIDNLRYAPATIEVNVGDTVVWVNNDDREHTVTADNGAFNSGRLRPGRTFSWTADRKGQINYGSDPFPRTRGVIVVK